MRAAHYLREVAEFTWSKYDFAARVYPKIIVVISALWDHVLCRLPVEDTTLSTMALIEG
jgi:hypothetical protein